MKTPKQPFTHKTPAPKGPQPPKSRMQHGEKVKPQKKLAGRAK